MREREGRREGGRLSRSLSQTDACGQNESSPCRCRVGRKNLICQLISPHNIAKRKAAQLSATLPHGGGIKQIRLNLQRLFPPPALNLPHVDPTQSTTPTPTPVVCCRLPVASCQLDTAEQPQSIDRSGDDGVGGVSGNLIFINRSCCSCQLASSLCLSQCV